MTDPRDYFHDMRRAIRAGFPAGDFTTANFAGNLVDSLKDNDPDLLHGWLESRAVELLTSEIRTIRNQDRARSFRDAPIQAFKETIGDPEKLSAAAATSIFDRFLIIDTKGTNRRIKDTTREDHAFAATCYESSAVKMALKCQFHKAISERIPRDGVLSDIMSPEDYIRLHDSIVNF